MRRVNLRTVRWALLIYSFFDLFFGGYCGGFLPLTPCAAAQFTTVSGTITDPNGLPYAFGTISAQLVSSGTPKFTASNQPYTPPSQPTGLSSAGSFIVQLADNTQLTPGGSTWTFTVSCGAGCVPVAGGKGPVSFTVTGITISGASQSLTATLTAAALALTAPISGSSAFPAITPGTNTGALVMGTAGSLTTSGIGQIASTQERWTVGAPIPTISTTTQTGGGLLAGHAGAWRITFNSAAGQTLPGPEFAPNTNYTTLGGTCASGSACTVTIAAPTLPSGYTSATFYGVDCASTPCSGGETTISGCVAITTACVETTAPAGSALPTVNTAIAQPSPLGTNLCSPGTNPMLFSFDGTNNYPYAGIDNANTGSNPPAPYNKLSFCRPIWINDTATDPPSGRNSLMLIFHEQGVGTDTNTGNQDRGLFVFGQDPTGTSTARYGMEAIQAEQDFNCGTCTVTGSPDGEVTAGSFQLGDQHTGSVPAPSSYGLNAIRATYFRNGAGTMSSCADNVCYAGINVAAINNNATDPLSGTGFAAGVFSTADSAGAAHGFGYDVYLRGGNGTFAQANIGLWLDDFKNVHANDYSIYSTGSRNFLGGQTTFSFAAGPLSSAPNISTGALLSMVPNCAGVGTAANPSVVTCNNSAAGSFSCATAASTGTCVVNTTAVTANSEILITQRADTTTGTRLGVTCNTTVSTVIPIITAVTAGTSFTINLGTITTNPECFSYVMVN